MSFDTHQLFIIEDGVTVDRTTLIHDESAFNWTNTRGRRGTATVPLMIDAGTSYMPKVGWPVLIYDVDTSDVTLSKRVWLGFVMDMDFAYWDDAGDLVITLNCVTFEAYFDTIQTPENDYLGQNAGAIFTAIFTAVIGQLPSQVPITLGTVDAGVDISERQYNGNSNSASDFQQLATDSAFVWYVDPRDAKVYFHAFDARPSAITLTTPDCLWETINWKQSQADFRDRQLIQALPPNTLPALTATFLGDGTTDTFTLPQLASQVTAAYITTAVYPSSNAVFTGQPNPGDVVQTDSFRSPGFPYTFVTTLDNTVTFQVLIGATAADTAQNLADAINANPATAGIGYSTPTWVNTEINAGAVTGSSFPVTSKFAGNLIINLTASAANFSWSDNPMAGGVLSGVVSLSVGTGSSGLFEVTYQPGSSTIQTRNPIADGVTLSVSYLPSVTGQLGAANDLAASLGISSQFRQQATRGANTAPDAQQQNAAILAAYATLPKVFTVQTFKPGGYCGELSTVLFTVPANAAAVLNGQWLIQEMRGDWIAGFEDLDPPYNTFRYTYTLINTTEISTYQDTLARLIDTGPLPPLAAPQEASPAAAPTGNPLTGGDGSGTMPAGQDWVQETLALAILDSNADLVAGGGDGKTLSSATRTFVSGDVGTYIVIAASTGWTEGSYLITSVSAGSAIVGTAPAADGTTGGLWGTADPHIYQFTWAPAISYWTSNPIAIVEVLTGNGDSPLTFTTKQTTPFRYAERGFVVEPISGNLGGDYTIEPGSGKITFRDAPELAQIVLVEYFPDQPHKLPRRKPGDVVHSPLFVVAKDDPDLTGKIIMTSPDGITWTERTTPIPSSGFCVAYGAGLYVVGADLASGTHEIATSPDAINWTARSSPADSHEVLAVIYAAGLFVALWKASGNTNVMTSPDGITWTSHTVPSPANNWTALAFGTGGFVATGTNGNAMTSPDGITWTDQSTSLSVDFDCVAFGAGIYSAIGGSEGSGEHLETSPDGVTWTLQPDLDSYPYPFLGVVFGGGQFVAVTATFIEDPANKSATSADGITWVTHTTGLNQTWQAVTFGAGIYCAVANDFGLTNAIMTSTDGVSWTSRTTPAASFCEAIIYG